MAWTFSEVKILTQRSELVRFRAGDVIFRQGDPGDRVLLVRRGLVEILSDAYGSRRRLALRGRGELLGEMALLDHLGRSATAVARTEVVARSLGREDFEQLLASTPALYRHLTGMISRRLRELQDTLVGELEKQNKGWKDVGFRSIGPYLLHQQLGQGGMGIIYRATHKRTNLARAVKVLTVPNEEQRARFTRECQMMARLVHPNIVRIEEGGLEGAFAYLAMELLEGESLDERLARGPLSEEEALRWFVPALRALAHAHARDIMHRDVKPGNLFMTTDGTLKLLDFGVARREHDPALTTSDNCFGTPRYLAPERIGGIGGLSDSFQKQADQYSTGVTLYQAVTGRAPFDSDDVAEILSAHLYDSPPLPSLLAPISRGLEAVILKMLKKDPLRRYPGAEAAAEALVASQSQVSAPSVSDDTVDLGRVPLHEEARPPRARRRAPVQLPAAPPLKGS